MATSIRKEKQVELQDGTKVSIKQLNIKSMRKFMTVFGEMAKLEQQASELDTEAEGKKSIEEMIARSAEIQDKILDLTIDAVQICLQHSAYEGAEDKDHLEEVLDNQSIQEILEHAGGITPGGGGNPNPMSR